MILTHPLPCQNIRRKKSELGRTKMKNWNFALNRWIKKNYEEGKYNPKPNASYDDANNKEPRYGAAKISDIEQALFELDQEKRSGVFF